MFIGKFIMSKQILWMQSRNSGKTATAKMLLQKLSISEFAELKGCSRQTIYANKDQLTFVTVPGARIKKILIDEKAIFFNPNESKINKRYAK
jgi:hypothetical protein